MPLFASSFRNWSWNLKEAGEAVENEFSEKRNEGATEEDSPRRLRKLPLDKVLKQKGQKFLNATSYT